MALQVCLHYVKDINLSLNVRKFCVGKSHGDIRKVCSSPVTKPFCPRLIPLTREECYYSVTRILLSLVLKMGPRQCPVLTRFICCSRDLRRSPLFVALRDLQAGVRASCWHIFVQVFSLRNGWWSDSSTPYGKWLSHLVWYSAPSCGTYVHNCQAVEWQISLCWV